MQIFEEEVIRKKIFFQVILGDVVPVVKGRRRSVQDLDGSVMTELHLDTKKESWQQVIREVRITTGTSQKTYFKNKQIGILLQFEYI